jgi:hypothetical protein
MRVLGLLLLIAVLAAIIAGVVLLVTDAGQSTNTGDLIKDELDKQLQALQDFLNGLGQ